MTTTQTRTQTNMINTSVADTIVQATHFRCNHCTNSWAVANNRFEQSSRV